MVKRCKVQNCGSSGKEKNISIFAVPKDTIQRKKWCEILNCNLNEVSYVCEKHFSPRHIRDSFTAQIPNGEVIFTRQYKRKILNKGALPKRNLDHSFQIEGTDKVLNLHTENEIEVPNITYNSIGNCKKEITIEKGINDNSENEQLDTITYNVYDSNFIDSSTISNISDIKNLFGQESTIHNNELILPEVKTELEINDISSSSAHHQSTNNTCEDLYLNLIQQILLNGLLVNLPNENWGIHKSIANKSIIFTHAEMISSPHQENTLIPICLKRIGFGPTIEVYFHTKNIKLTSISKPKTVEELEHILLKIDTYKICSGGPSIKYYKNAHLECAVRDDLCWRHKECPIILDKGLICTHCVNLHTLLARCIHNQRKNYTRIRLLGSPDTKKKAAIIRAKSNIRLKKLCRKERVLKRITEQLNQSVLKITQLERNKLVDEIDKLNLPHSQYSFQCDSSGLENSDSITDQQADHALVFMYSSLAHTFHQPVGVFACKGGTPSKQLATLIIPAIIAIEKAGGKVHALICDGASTNRGIWSEFGITENTITWLDNWENEMNKELEVIVTEKSKAINNELRKKLKSHKGTNVTKVKVDKVVLQKIDRDYKIKVKQCKNNFLSSETAERLRVTLYSISNLSRYLLNSCQFEYILTSKLNQDCLERFFGIIRQAGCQNDHPTFPTFMQLYHLLSVYKILKPPKFGNSRNADSVLEQRPKISFQEFKEAFSTNESKSSYREQYVQNLQAKLDGYIANECWECDDIFELDNEMSPQIINCVIYYTCGFICRKMLKKTKCIVCREAFASKEENSTLAIANLLNLKNRGGLMLTNIFLYKILREIENLFIKYIDSGNVYLNVINSITESNIKLTFPCEIHKDYMLSYCIQYYLEVRM